MGERIYKWADVLKVEDRENSLFCYIWINPEKKSKSWFGGDGGSGEK